MHSCTRFRQVLCAIGVLLIIADSSRAQSPVGTSFTYQGQLKQLGTPVTQSTDFQFRLYDGPTGGNQVGPQLADDAVTVTGGLFTVELDFGVAAFAANQALWLEIDVRSPAGGGPFTTLTPRQPLTPTPFSLNTRGISVAANGNLGLGVDAQPSQRLYATAPPGYEAAIRGESDTRGVSGVATGNGTGVVGSAEGSGHGVFGDVSGTGAGVFGYARATSGENYGVRGRTESPDGFAAYFDGRGYFSGNLGLGTTSPETRLQVDGLMSFVRSPGDEPNSGKIAYRGLLPSGDALAITGAGTNNTNRRVHVFDVLTAGDPNGAQFNVNVVPGRVGIGTASPTAKLHLGGIPGVDGMRFPDDSLQTSAASIVDVANVKSLGATGNGSTDDSAAIQAAVNLVRSRGGGALYFPTGRYIVSARIAIDVPCTIFGDSQRLSQIQWVNAQGGIQFNGGGDVLENKRFLYVRDIGLLTANVNGGTALEVNFDVPSGQPGQYVHITDTDIGLGPGGIWTLGVDLVNARGAVITSCDFRNNHTLSDFAGTAIRIRGGMSPVLETISNCTAFYWDTVLSVQDSIEGVIVNNINAVACDYGLIWNTAIQLSQFSVDNCHLDVNVVGIRMSNCANAFITNVLIYQRNFTQAPGYGIGVEGASMNVKIANCTIQKHSAPASFEGIVVSGPSTHISVNQNSLVATSSGVWLRPGSANCVVLDNQTISTGIPILDQGTGNYVRTLP